MYTYVNIKAIVKSTISFNALSEDKVFFYKKMKIKDSYMSQLKILVNQILNLCTCTYLIDAIFVIQTAFIMRI